MATDDKHYGRIKEEPRAMYNIRPESGEEHLPSSSHSSGHPLDREGRVPEVPAPSEEQCPNPSWTKRTHGRVTTFSNGNVSFSMVAVEGGEFMMGMDINHSAFGSGSFPELKAHRVMLSDYSIGETPVTQALWQEVMGYNPSYFKESCYFDGDLQRPVESISVQECYDFMKRLGALTGEQFTLPTEAQWEYAARGGRADHGYIYSGGNDPLAVGWFKENSLDHQGRCVTQSVRMKAPNELGIYDMSGNVSEWCRDMYDNTYYSNSKMRNPCALYGADNYRIIRGGYYQSERREMPLRFRRYFYTLSYNSSVGLRLGMDSHAK